MDALTATSRDELDRLIDGACDQTLSAAELQELSAILASDPRACDHYISYMAIHRELVCQWLPAVQFSGEELSRFAAAETDWPSPNYIGDRSADLPPTLPPSLRFTSSAIPSLLATSPYYGWPAAYLIATVICGVALTVATFIHVAHPTVVMHGSSSLARVDSVEQAPGNPVGRITGMSHCRWNGSDRVSPNVGVGSAYRLSAGLLEITYDAGARVVLQGPVDYRVDSAVGGYLASGKLTANVETHEGEPVHGPQSSTDGALFTITTPTAVVTDLGTEFGVEVTSDGNTYTRVFRGLVRVDAIAVADAASRPAGRLLRANQSAQVVRDDGDRAIVVDSTAASPEFVRRLPVEKIKVFDLVDAAAGGTGFSGKRGRGIDPLTGNVSDAIRGASDQFEGDYRYHRVDDLPFVDGVFVPDGSKGTVQIDSAGHLFPDCPATDNRTWLYVWAGGALPSAVAERLTPALAGVDYFGPGHSALFLHANKGITFDLDAVRRANPDHKLSRFRSVAGNMEPESGNDHNVSADIWVMVDGNVRFKRRDINHFIGAMPIDIPIGDRDRFLTLVATDGGDSYTCDLVIFGDPRLELLSNGAVRNKRE